MLNIHWKDQCWSWSSNTLAIWCKEPTHWKRSWSWERLKAGGEGDNRGWDGWMASPTRWTWVWAVSRSWWWTGKPGVLQSMGHKADTTQWLNNRSNNRIQEKQERNRHPSVEKWDRGKETSSSQFESKLSYSQNWVTGLERAAHGHRVPGKASVCLGSLWWWKLCKGTQPGESMSTFDCRAWWPLPVPTPKIWKQWENPSN